MISAVVANLYSRCIDFLLVNLAGHPYFIFFDSMSARKIAIFSCFTLIISQRIIQKSILQSKIVAKK